MLEELIEEYGYSISVAVKIGLRLLYHKELSKDYIEKRTKATAVRLAKLEITPEQECIQKGGRVEIEDNIKYCIVESKRDDYGSMIIKEPI